MILSPPGQTDQSDQVSFEPLSEERPVVEIEQPVRDMDAEIRVYPDRLASKAAWWIFDSGNPFVLSPLLIDIHDDMSGIEESGLG